MKIQDKKAVNLMIASACAVAVVSIGGCGSDSKKRYAPAAIVTPVALKSTVSVALLDAKTGNPVTSDVTLTAVGADAAKIKDANGNAGPWVLTASPLGSSITLTGDVAASVVISADAEGYFSTTTPVEIKANKNEVLIVKLASKSATGGSILTVQATTTADPTTGALAADLAAVTPTPAAGSVAEAVNAGTKADIILPQNAIMKDEAGNVVAGDIKMEVGFFPNDATGAAPAGESPLSSFPGGLDGVAIENPAAGTEQGGSFISGGLVAIDITNDAGQKVATFDKPLEVKTTMSADTINPTTGLKIATGDVIPVWSYDEATGKWTEEPTANIGAFDAATNTFEAHFSATHLSYWNLDWYESERCSTNPVKVVIKDSNGNVIPDTLGLTADLRRVGGGWARSTNVSGSSLEINNAPKNIPMTLTLSDEAGTKVLTQDVPNLCDLTSATVPAAAVVVPPSVKITPNAQVVCRNGTGKPIKIPAYVMTFSGSYDFVTGEGTYKYIKEEYLSADPKPYDLKKGINHFFYAYPIQDVKNGVGEVILSAWSGETVTNFTATEDQTVNIDFKVECPDATGGTTGGQ